MSNNIPDNIFQKFCLLSQKVQKLENQVENERVSPSMRVQMHKQLESLQGSIETLRRNALDAQRQAKQLFMQFEEMENQIISLYRKVEEGFENFEISLITKEAFDLTQSLTKGKMIEIAKKVNELRYNVHFLFKHRRPSMQHRKIVHLALKLSDQADEILQSAGAVSKKNLQLIQLLKVLLKEAVARADSLEDPDQAELAMDLFEIAELFYHKKKKEGFLRLQLIRSLLSPAQQARLDAASDYPKEMVKILLEIADGDPCVEWEEKKTAVIYNLLA
ncbi:MAG: hypothetical protein K1000chlam3_01622 [Chlamydiae bacterium]|nr:hypothetical protein [Chlamydiota bacterium]